jgi:hypothetical protein
MNGPLRSSFIAAVSASFLVLLAGCPSPDDRSDTIDPTTLPQSVRADYDVFAQRCSKCHALARPLNSGIVDDNYWAMYVARMRRQPSSGISIDDSRVILRFLHYYSLEQIRRKAVRPTPTFDPPEPPPPPGAGTSDAG